MTQRSTGFHFAKDHALSFAYNGIYNHDNVDSRQTGNIAGNALTRSHSLLQNLRADYELPFGLTTSAEMTFYETPEHQTLASTMPTGSLRYEVENRQRVNRWKFSLAEEHSLGKAWHVNYGVVYTTSINHGSQAYSDINTPTRGFHSRGILPLALMEEMDGISHDEPHLPAFSGTIVGNPKPWTPVDSNNRHHETSHPSSLSPHAAARPCQRQHRRGRLLSCRLRCGTGSPPATARLHDDVPLPSWTG